MLPEKSCPNCEHFKKKEHLTKNNRVIAKEYCQRFHQELFSHNSCPKFRYHEDLETDVGTIYGTIGAVSGMIMVASIIAGIVAVAVKSDLILCTSVVITILSAIFLVIFMLIGNKIEKRMLYGNSAEDFDDED